MVKKRTKVPKSRVVWHQSAEEATLSRMPKLNGHACGSGTHGDTKYNRCKSKRAWKQEIAKEARTRGPLPFLHPLNARRTRTTPVLVPTKTYAAPSS